MPIRFQLKTCGRVGHLPRLKDLFAKFEVGNSMAACLAAYRDSPLDWATHFPFGDWEEFRVIPPSGTRRLALDHRCECVPVLPRSFLAGATQNLPATQSAPADERALLTQTLALSRSSSPDSVTAVDTRTAGADVSQQNETPHLAQAGRTELAP